MLDSWVKIESNADNSETNVSCLASRRTQWLTPINKAYLIDL